MTPNGRNFIYLVLIFINSKNVAILRIHITYCVSIINMKCALTDSKNIPKSWKRLIA